VTPAEWVEAAVKQAEAAGVRVAIIQVEHLRALLAEREQLIADLLEIDSQRAQAVTLIARGIDDDPCEVDHNGLCQTHWLSPAPCRNAEARRLLGLDAA
jgi:hypothetical protein